MTFSLRDPFSPCPLLFSCLSSSMKTLRQKWGVTVTSEEEDWKADFLKVQNVSAEVCMSICHFKQSDYFLSPWDLKERRVFL